MLAAWSAFSASLQLPETFPPHPRLLLSAEELPGIRERAQGSCKQHFTSLREQAENWLGTKVELPDRGGQWFHWYSCPKHGARLRNEGPTRHVCPIDGEELKGYPYDDVALSTVHNRWASGVRALGLVRQITGDTKYVAKAKEILLAYGEKYESYPLHDIHGKPKVGGGKVGPQTLDESTWLITMVEGADCIWADLAEDERTTIERQLIRPATKVIRDHKMGIHNIQCWKNSAVGLAGLLLGDRELVKEAIEGEAGYFNQMRKGVLADGPWFEGAWGYHFYTVSALLHLTEGAHHSGINLYGPELKRMFDAPLALAMPNLTLPAFNDSNAVDLRGTAAAYETALARFKDDAYAVLTGRSNSDAALLHGRKAAAKTAARDITSKNFPASGNVILASGTSENAVWLCMKYGPHGGGHGHPDKLNFVLYGLGQVLAPDPGTANYGVPIQAGWYRTTLAHNTLVVDGVSQKPAEGKCVAFLSTNGFSAVTAEAGKIYPGVSFHRTVALLGNDLVVFIDQVRSDASHVLDLAYHNQGSLTAMSGGTPWQSPTNAGYAHLRDMQSVQSIEGNLVEFRAGGGKRVQWTMAGGETTTFVTGTGVGRHTEDRVPVVIARRQAKDTDYLWCVNLNSETPVRLSSTRLGFPEGSAGVASAVTVTKGNRTWTLVANPAGMRVTLGGSELSSKLALFTEESGVNRLAHAAAE